MLLAEVGAGFAVAAVLHRFLEQRAKGAAELRQVDPILRPLRPRDAGLHIAQVQIEVDAVINLALARHAEHFLRAEIRFKRTALLVRATGRAQVIDRFRVDREVSHGRAVLGRHVADGRAIRQRQRGGACAIKFDKFPDHFLRPEHLGDVEREVGRGDPFAQRAAHVHAHDLRREEINRLPEHARLRFDSAHAPADDTEAVNHGGMGVGPHERVGVEELRVES